MVEKSPERTRGVDFYDGPLGVVVWVCDYVTGPGIKVNRGRGPSHQELTPAKPGSPL